MADVTSPSKIPLRRDAQQWVYDWVVKETGKVFHFQSDGRGGLPAAVRSHAMIAKHLGQLAARVEKVAAEEAAAGHDETALDWYFDAATLYAEAQHTVLAPTQEKAFTNRAPGACLSRRSRSDSSSVVKKRNTPFSGGAAAIGLVVSMTVLPSRFSAPQSSSADSAPAPLTANTTRSPNFAASAIVPTRAPGPCRPSQPASLPGSRVPRITS